MLKEKEMQLKSKLKNIIKEIGYMNDVKQDLVSEFKSRNLNGLRAAWAFSENLDLNTLTNSEEDIRFLFLFAYSLNEVLKDRVDVNIKINIEEYFTKIEYNQWKDYKEEEKIKGDIYPITFENVQQVGDKIWQTTLTAQELDQLNNDNILLYNFKTQRNPKITSMGEQINLDKQKVKEIKERLLNNEQYPDPIILNILNNGESKVQFNEKNKTLTIFEDSIINIVDGFHRKTAISLALQENEALPFNCQITFTFLSEKAAHDYMSQKDKQKPIKKEYIEQMDYSRPENLVIDVILDDKLSELAKVMKDDDRYIELERALTKKSIIAEAIKECYEDQLNLSTNIRNIGKWIVEFTDYLMAQYIEEFIVNPYEIKKTSYINHKNMFYGYIALSAKIQDNKDWKNLLSEKVNSIDFSIDNPLWKDLGISNKDANKTLRKKLYNLLTEGV